MWFKISSIIIKNRLWLVLFTFLLTGFMAYKAKDIELTYDFVKVLPSDDKDLLYFNEFKEKYGEDGNLMVVGISDSALFQLDNFNRFYDLNERLSNLHGMQEVVSLAKLPMIVRDSEARKFKVQPVFSNKPEAQVELDSLLAVAVSQRFYDGMLYNEHTGAALIALTIEPDVLNSSKRQEMMDEILAVCKEFSADTDIEAHYAGLPFVRATMVNNVSSEFKLFLALAVVVTSAILFFFFRSFFAVGLTFLIITITVLWTMGTIVLFGYKMTLLTGILPALIIVIGIPNCVYMYNKYHNEYRKHGNKTKAVSRIIQKIGQLTLMTNTTTAIGFLVLNFTNVTILKEFGLVAGIISICTFFITIMVVPSLLFFLPEPSSKQLKHLDFKLIRSINFGLEHLVLRYRPFVYVFAGLVLAGAFAGISKIQAVSFMVDDLPEKSTVKSDLKFFEENFNGIMPLEIVVDMGKDNAIKSLSNMKKLEQVEEYLNSLEQVSPPISILNIIKGSTQAFYGGIPEKYVLPTSRDMPFIMRYFGNQQEENTMLRSLMDPNGREVRFTTKVADLGTNEMNRLVHEEINPALSKMLADSGFEFRVTGTTLLFLKGNEYLINGLTGSLLFAFALISVLMAMQFKSIKMVLISLIPNVIPLLATMGIMGFFNIPLKPSTALIFSIAFGISVDDTIHYLSKYKQELIHYRGNVLQAVTRSLEEAGTSMIYTSIVLFCGFVIFAWSDFGGTVALGILTSITLMFAMLTNLTILPSLLLTFSAGINKNLFPVVRKQTRFHMEEDDVELDISKLKVKNQKVYNMASSDAEEKSAPVKMDPVRIARSEI
ncbi:MMPL family transporter [Cytophagaceae bacterium ABcell3]|nr:MMPL family transporter [Cytophagaceae bacterium ABcell3]